MRLRIIGIAQVRIPARKLPGIGIVVTGIHVIEFAFFIINRPCVGGFVDEVFVSRFYLIAVFVVL
jgi:hypothetical protein